MALGIAAERGAHADDPASRDATPRSGVTTGGERVVLDDVDLSAATFDQVAAGSDFTLALAHDGTLYAWGANSWGQLGTGAVSAEPQRPVKVNIGDALAGSTITQIAAGGQSAAVLASDGHVYTWGSNRYGALGANRGEAYLPAPVMVSTASDLAGKIVRHIAVGDDFMVAQDSAGRVYAWGSNGDGQLGSGTPAGSRRPVAVDVTGVLSGVFVTQISAAHDHVAVLGADGRVYAWGRNDQGALGDGTRTSSPVPVLARLGGALTGKTVTDVATSRGSTFVLASGRVFGWGRNNDGELGNGSEALEWFDPVAADTGGALAGKWVDQISAAGSTVMVRDSAGGGLHVGRRLRRAARRRHPRGDLEGAGARRPGPLPVRQDRRSRRHGRQARRRARHRGSGLHLGSGDRAGWRLFAGVGRPGPRRDARGAVRRPPRDGRGGGRGGGGRSR